MNVWRKGRIWLETVSTSAIDRNRREEKGSEGSALAVPFVTCARNPQCHSPRLVKVESADICLLVMIAARRSTMKLPYSASKVGVSSCKKHLGKSREGVEARDDDSAVDRQSASSRRI